MYLAAVHIDRLTSHPSLLFLSIFLVCGPTITLAFNPIYSIGEQLSETESITEILETSSHNSQYLTTSDIAIDLYDSLLIFQDVQGNKKIEDIIQNSQWFNANNSSDSNLYDDVYWIKLNVAKRTYGRYSLLHIAANNWNQSWDSIDVWIINSEEEYVHYKTGNRVDKDDKPVVSDLNLIDLSRLEEESITIIYRLAGSTSHLKHQRISSWLCNPNYYSGFLPKYPFKGHFLPKTSQGAFRSNPITSFEIIEFDNDSPDIQFIADNWSSFPKYNLFDITHEEGKDYWIRLDLKGSPYFQGQQLFHISSEQGNDQFSFDFIDTYTTRDHSTFEYQKTGDQIPLHERPLEFWANFIIVDIGPTDSVTLYMHARGVDKRYIMTDILLHHVDPNSLFPQQSKEAWNHGIFTGILGIKFIFFLLLSIFAREKIYLYFSIMSLGFFLVLGFDDNMYSRYVAFPELRNQHIFLFYLGLFLSQIGFFNFTKIYFAYKIGLTSKFIKAFLFISFLIHVNAYVQLRFIDGISGYAHLPHALVALSILIGIFSVIVIAIRAKKSTESSKILFLSAFIPLTVTVFIALSRPILTQVFGDSLFADQLLWANNQDSVKLSIVFMLTMLAVSVGLRTMKLKMDKATALKFVEKNKIIAAKSKQNELLMKEIHHRVKNNLQILSSLLNLQSDHLTDSSAIDALQEGRNRVESMGMIHQKLYSTSEVTSVNMDEYVLDLCRYLEDSFSDSKKKITIQEEVFYSYMDVDYAIPLGLIINELITNSVKYAYAERKEGVITLILKETNNQLYLEVSDYGTGHPPFRCNIREHFIWI